MESDTHVPMEETPVFVSFVVVADQIWDLVARWKPLAVDTVGKQLIRAVDSIGANLVEGDGRYSDADALHFFVIARASAREARYWIQRAAVRSLLPQPEAERLIQALAGATRQLNGLIRYRRHNKNRNIARETAEPYASQPNDPFTEP